MGRKIQAASDSIELFATGEGIRTVESPVRQKILLMLKERELTFDEIVSGSGRAKSTVSVHLKMLVDERIIDSVPDPLDARKKIFFLNSSHIGDLSKHARACADIKSHIAGYDIDSGNTQEFFKLMFRTIKIGLLCEGVNIDPILHEAGKNVGERLYEKVADRDIGRFIANIAEFWENHGLGRIVAESLDPVTLYVYDCFECKDLPDQGKPACSFDSGILSALFSAYYGESMAAEEVDCYAKGNDRCKFIIKKSKNFKRT